MRRVRVMLFFVCVFRQAVPVLQKGMVHRVTNYYYKGLLYAIKASID